MRSSSRLFGNRTVTIDPVGLGGIPELLKNIRLCLRKNEDARATITFTITRPLWAYITNQMKQEDTMTLFKALKAILKHPTKRFGYSDDEWLREELHHLFNSFHVDCQDRLVEYLREQSRMQYTAQCGRGEAMLWLAKYLEQGSRVIVKRMYRSVMTKKTWEFIKANPAVKTPMQRQLEEFGIEEDEAEHMAWAEEQCFETIK